jgi:hypothetical protein
MTKEVPELLLLDASRNYRERFELRFAKFPLSVQVETANALMDCAAALSKVLGRMPDNVIFGRDVFTKEQAEQLVSRLHELHAQAESRAFQAGVTAVLALQSIASLVLLRHVATFSATRDRCERELTRMGRYMEQLLEIHRANSAL